MPSADVVLGGFPCQEFSSCGPQGGVGSRRGRLFKVLTNYAAQHRPKVVVAENVANLAFINGGKDLRAIRRELERAGYIVQVWHLFGPDHGVPQMRRRLIIVGVRDDLEGSPAAPVAAADPTKYTTSWAIDDLKWDLTGITPNQDQFFRAGLAKNGHGQGDERNLPDQPAYTIRSNCRSRVQFHYDLNRRLTVRECARIQTFPDTFVFPDEATPSIRQIGNAVPPAFGHAVGMSVAKFLSDLG